MTAHTDLVEVFARQVERDLPVGTWEQWPGGWRNEIEAAVIDAVFSIRAVYGQPGDCDSATGVRRVVACWRRYRDPTALDDLNALVGFDQWAATQERMGQRVAGRTKSEVVTDVARRLIGAGCSHANEVVPRSKKQRSAWIQTRGLGPVTWSYFTMLLGHADVKADTMLRRYTERSLPGRHLSDEAIRELVTDVAHHLARTYPDALVRIDATSLDHAIWNYERSSSRR
jgi:hypothetical protein